MLAQTTINNQLGLQRLLAITDGCRPDMHEPDEQGVKARIVGDHLDNARGDYVEANHIIQGFQEFVVILERLRDGKTTIETFNLASLIALARQAPCHTPEA